MLFVLCILGGRKLAVAHTLSQCPQLPSGERILCTATSSSGSNRKVLACVPYGGPFEPVPRDPASSFLSSLLLSVGRVQLCLTVSSPSSEISWVWGLADDLGEPLVSKFSPVCWRKWQGKVASNLERMQQSPDPTPCHLPKWQMVEPICLFQCDWITKKTISRWEICFSGHTHKPAITERTLVLI